MSLVCGCFRSLMSVGVNARGHGAGRGRREERESIMSVVIYS